MTTNPTLDPDDYSRALIQETIRPGLETHLETAFNDPHAAKRGTAITDQPGEWPPLVVTALPEGGRTLYPHVVVSEGGDSAGPIDARQAFSQHDFTVGVELHGETTTQMFNLRGLARGWFLRNRDTLRDAGFAIESPDNISGNAASWDPTSKTVSWSLTVEGLIHTHPNT